MAKKNSRKGAKSKPKKGGSKKHRKLTRGEKAWRTRCRNAGGVEKAKAAVRRNFGGKSHRHSAERERFAKMTPTERAIERRRRRFSKHERPMSSREILRAERRSRRARRRMVQRHASGAAIQAKHRLGANPGYLDRLRAMLAAKKVAEHNAPRPGGFIEID